MRPGSRLPRVVAMGGGHGLFASLQALRRLTSQVTAVVTVADDGGSSGRLQRELAILPVSYTPLLCIRDRNLRQRLKS